jgi:hypothetical protein
MAKVKSKTKRRKIRSPGRLDSPLFILENAARRATEEIEFAHHYNDVYGVTERNDGRIRLYGALLRACDHLIVAGQVLERRRKRK